MPGGGELVGGKVEGMEKGVAVEIIVVRRRGRRMRGGVVGVAGRVVVDIVCCMGGRD